MKELQRTAAFRAYEDVLALGDSDSAEGLYDRVSKKSICTSSGSNNARKMLTHFGHSPV